MANFSLPTTASLYTDVISIFNDKLSDVAKGLDPATSTPTNVPTNSVRWTSAANKWQKWNGTAWVDLTATYAINISGSAASATTAGSAATADTLTTARTINGTSFNGSGNITTANWGTARTLTIGSTGKSVNGSANVSWTLAELGTEVYRTVPRDDSQFLTGRLRVVSTNQTISVGPAADSLFVVYNSSSSPITLSQGAGLTLVLDGSSLTGSRTLLPFGKATIHYITTTLVVVSGSVT